MATRYGTMAYKGIILVTLLAIVAAFLVIRPVGAQSSPPGPPTGLTAKAVGVAGEDVVELSWTAPAAGRASVTGYKIETSTNDGATWAESIADTEGSGADNEVSTVVETYYARRCYGNRELLPGVGDQRRWHERPLYPRRRDPSGLGARNQPRRPL